MADRQIDFLDASDALQTALYGLGLCHQGLYALGHVLQDEGNPEVGAWMDQLILLLPEIAGRIEQHHKAAEAATKRLVEIHRHAVSWRREGEAPSSV